MRPALSVLYRGPLDSCNYGCAYCPFAKREARRARLEHDRRCLERFVTWALAAAAWDFRVLFTPYGEALIWPAYQDAIRRISRAPHVQQVSIQTNASGPLGFLDQVDLARVSLWISWHPTEIDEARFAKTINGLYDRGVRLSVGAVAVPAHFERIADLRAQLPAAVPFWINAQKPGVRYDEAARLRWRALDPDFDRDAHRHRTRGLACKAGEDVVSVDGAGTITRCHFVDEVLGNLYTDDLGALLRPRPCPRLTCDCYIGYAHVPSLGLRDAVSANDLLSRRR